MTYAQDERAGVVAALREAGPDAPTLCTGWTTRDLAAHLITRERRLDAAPGIMIHALAGHTKRVQDSIAAREWGQILSQVASGPPWYSPFKPVDRWANLVEMFIHHEDILRGGADPDQSWSPRPLSPGLEKALLRQLIMLSKTSLGSLPASVTLLDTDGARLATGGRGEPVTVTGAVGELLLFCNGRRPVQVDLAGPADAVAAVVGAVHGF